MNPTVQKLVAKGAQNMLGGTPLAPTGPQSTVAPGAPRTTPALPEVADAPGAQAPLGARRAALPPVVPPVVADASTSADSAEGSPSSSVSSELGTPGDSKGHATAGSAGRDRGRLEPGAFSAVPGAETVESAAAPLTRPPLTDTQVAAFLAPRNGGVAATRAARIPTLPARFGLPHPVRPASMKKVETLTPLDLYPVDKREQRQIAVAASVVKGKNVVSYLKLNAVRTEVTARIEESGQMTHFLQLDRIHQNQVISAALRSIADDMAKADWN